MAYIGKTPVVGNFQICDAISVVNGQAAYTLQVGGANVIPESANHMIVSLNGVIQKPGSSFTVSGSTMTFASNLATGDSIDFVQILGNVLDIGAPSDATVTTAKLGDSAVTTAKINDGAITSAKINSSVGLGITEADQWRWTASFTGNAIPVTSNWERNDTSFDKIGTGMTESSGIFTFPSTGIYYITSRAYLSLNSNSRYNELAIQLSTNGGSSYSVIADTYTHISNNASDTTYANAFVNAIIDVTNTTNFKVSIKVTNADVNTSWEGNTNVSSNSTTFIRLGDT